MAALKEVRVVITCFSFSYSVSLGSGNFSERKKIDHLFSSPKISFFFAFNI